MNQELPDVQARFRKGRGTRDKNCQHVLDHQESKRIQENISTSISLTKILKEMGVPDHLTYILRNLYVGQEATARTGNGQLTGSKSETEYSKAVYCHPAYLTSMQSTS